MNTFLTALMIDIVDPVAAAGLGESVEKARRHLSEQIEAGGLVRYHGRPDAPTIGVLGCRITPDTDDTALVWRIAPGLRSELLPQVFATLGHYRTSDGLYRTWLAPADQYECINPGKDPNPADVAIQMHLLLMLAKFDPPAAHRLCDALETAVTDDRIWVYYKRAPLVPILRQSDLQRSGCQLRLPASKLRAEPGQEAWMNLAEMLAVPAGGTGHGPTKEAAFALLRSFASDDFAALRKNPPLLYHNDLTASVRRFYWSEEVGYALWLRLYFETVSRQ
jgi:hypothetical protein